MEIVELGVDSKRLLMEIRDRLPAATATPPVPADLERWEIFGPREQAILVAWVTPDNQVAWVKKGNAPTVKGCRMLYVGVAS